MLNPLYNFIGLDIPLKIIAKNPSISCHDFVKRCIDAFKIKYNIKDLSSKNLKSTIYFCTHHTGALDFLTIYNYLSKNDPSLKIIMNEKLMKLPPLAKSGIKVYPISAGIQNEEARMEIINVLNRGENIIVFPAGKVAKKENGIIQDYTWRLGIFELLQNYAKFAVPVYIEAQNSNFFYFIRKKFPKISMLYFMYYLKKSKDKNFANIYIGNEIPVINLKNKNTKSVMNHIRKKTYNLKSKEI